MYMVITSKTCFVANKLPYMYTDKNETQLVRINSSCDRPLQVKMDSLCVPWHDKQSYEALISTRNCPAPHKKYNLIFPTFKKPSPISGNCWGSVRVFSKPSQRRFKQTGHLTNQPTSLILFNLRSCPLRLLIPRSLRSPLLLTRYQVFCSCPRTVWWRSWTCKA